MSYDELSDRLEKIEDSVRAIEMAVIGNESHGIKGMVQRVKDLEGQVKEWSSKVTFGRGAVWATLGICGGIFTLAKMILSSHTP